MIEREYEEVLQCVSHSVDFPRRKLCDGVPDCPDNSDEFGCVEMKWSDRPIPKQCESDKNCTSQYLYQYSAINGKCEICAESSCGSCGGVPKFLDLHSCLKRCQVPDSIRSFSSLKINFLYAQLYPQLYTQTNDLIQNWRNGQIRPIEGTKTTRRREKNFVLRGVLLLSSLIRNQRRTFEVVMTKAEEMGPEWLKDDGFTARLTVTLRRDRFLHPGREYILTGHTNGKRDRSGKLHISHAVFRKSKSRSLRREIRQRYSLERFG